MNDTPRVTVPVDEQALKRLQEEADRPGLGDSAMVFGPDLRALLRAYRSLSAAPAPEGGAVKGPGDYTMSLTEPQAFERFPALASHIERMAVGRSVGSLIEWDAFLREMNAALATREEAPAQAGEVDEDWIRGLIGEAVCMAEDQEREDESDEEICRIAESVLNAIRPYLRAQPPAREDAQPVWVDGVPTKHHAKEWFIAETTFGDRVVLTALPEEYTYDFKTADETYIKADRIKRWMPFPDSQYLFSHPAPDALRVAVEALEPFARLDVLEPNGVIIGLERWHFERARQALAALQAEQRAK